MLNVAEAQEAIGIRATAASPRTRNPLALWHLLSLDAPTVATVWLIFVAHVGRTLLPSAVPFAMFLAVWLIYAADRLLDARFLDARLLDAHQSHHLESPHTFHRRHRRVFTVVAFLDALAIVLLLPAIPSALLGPYLILATLLFAWLLLIHFTSLALPKPYAPGIFFAAAIFIPALQQYSIVSLLLPALCFAALCTFNCLCLQFWERHPNPAPASGLLAFGLALTFLPALFPSPITHAIYLAAAALLTLSRFRSHLRPATLRAAADLALLTPLLFLPSLK